MNTELSYWPQDSICINPVSLEAPAIAAAIYARSCRYQFDAPGFCVVNVGQSIGSVALRRLMLALKQAMAAIHEAKTANTLSYLSAMRFDQQETTRPHLDGGPDECLLMLGYEPSTVDAELEIADYAKCAFDLGLSPSAFMTKYNPMFESGYELLRPYTSRIPCYASTDFQIVCINNSCAPFSHDQPKWQGVLHTATMLTPDPAKQRIVNSTMIASVPLGTRDVVTAAQQQVFMTTSAVCMR